MTKKDYELIAKTLRNYNYLVPATTPAPEVIEGICKDLATRLGDDNKKFNRDRFLAACGVTQ
jgi:hypothetical protein